MSLVPFSFFDDLHILFMVTKHTFELFSQCFEIVNTFFDKCGQITCKSH